MIHSSMVPIFREDRGNLLTQPYSASFITAPAVNAGAVREREPNKAGSIQRVMMERIRFIISVAVVHGHRAVILGAFGCGVFRNDPKEVAQAFRQVLIDEQFGVFFDKIVFAVLDSSPDLCTLNEFKRVCG